MSEGVRCAFSEATLAEIARVASQAANRELTVGDLTHLARRAYLDGMTDVIGKWKEADAQRAEDAA